MIVACFFLLMIGFSLGQEKENPNNETTCTFSDKKCDTFIPTCKLRKHFVIGFNKQHHACEICDGILVTEREDMRFRVVYHLAPYFVTISIDNYTYTLIPGSKFRIRDRERSKTETQLLTSEPFIDIEKGYKIQLVADTIQFTALKYGFHIIWKENNIMDFMPESCLLGRLEGLCGYYVNNTLKNEMRTKNGSCPENEYEFCAEWELDYNTCIVENIDWEEDYSLIEKAKTICQELRNDINEACNIEAIELAGESYNAIEDSCGYAIFPNCTESHTYKECKCEAIKYLLSETKCIQDNGKLLENNDCGIIECKNNQTYRCLDICKTKCPGERDERCEHGELIGMACACEDGYVESNNKCIKEKDCENCTVTGKFNIPKRYFNVDGCTNRKEITNLRDCNGKCNTISKYDSNGIKYTKNCFCCVPSRYEEVAIELYCDKNDTTVSHFIREPAECKGEPCLQQVI